MKINKNYSYLVYLLFIGLWGSIGSDPYNVLFLFEDDKKFLFSFSMFSISDTVNFTRALTPTIILIITLYLLVKKKLFNNHPKFLIILLLIQIFQLIATLFSNNSIISSLETDIDHVGRYHWIISSLSTIFLFMIMDKIEGFDFKNIFFISIFFLFFMVIFFSYRNLSDFLISGLNTPLYNLDVLRDSAYFLNHSIPRVTGISRSIIFLYIIIFFLSKNSKGLIKWINYFLLIILGSLLFLYQSKFGLITFIIINIIFLWNSIDKIKSIKFILTILIIQIFFSYFISSARYFFKYLPNLNTDKKEIVLNSVENKSIDHFRNVKDYRIKGVDQIKFVIFSGRLQLWIDSFKYIKEKPIIGYGSMSDRVLLNQIRKNNNQIINPVSNAFIYAQLSGGILTLLLFLRFWFQIKMSILNVFNLKIIKNNYSKIGIVLILLIFLRCIIENSIMLFGVDYLLIINSLYLIKKI